MSKELTVGRISFGPAVTSAEILKTGGRITQLVDPKTGAPTTIASSNNIIFVFGSNLAGIHGRGSALHARQRWGARQFQGVGRQGNSYAIPTKDEQIRSLSLTEIAKHVTTFIQYVKDHPELFFVVVEIGCGLAKYDPSDIAPMFKELTYAKNVQLPTAFMQELTDHGRAPEYLKWKDNE